MEIEVSEFASWISVKFANLQACPLHDRVCGNLNLDTVLHEFEQGHSEWLVPGW